MRTCVQPCFPQLGSGTNRSPADMLSTSSSSRENLNMASLPPRENWAKILPRTRNDGVPKWSSSSTRGNRMASSRKRSRLTMRTGRCLLVALAAAEQRQLQFGQPGEVALQLLDFLAERMHVLELAVDRGEAHVGHLVEVLQLAHHQLADLARRHFAFAAAAQVVDDRAHRAVHIVGGDRPLLQRALETHPELALVEHLAPLAALHHRRQLQLRCLVGIEALATLRA